MITNRNERLLQTLVLEPGETWLVSPRLIDKKQYILTPTIKWGMKSGSYSFRTELFGPLLSVACIEDLQEGIDLMNGLGYGLTSGLQSLDETRQKIWKSSLMAGNLYINRGITGVTVDRQPFGGMKLSAFGGGMRAGDPNYCSCFVKIVDKPDSKIDYRQSYTKALQEEFSKPRDVNNLCGEQNLFHYLPLKNMVLRLFPDDRSKTAEMIIYAIRLCRTPLIISYGPSNDRTEALADTDCRLRREAMDSFINSISGYERIRTCSPKIPVKIYGAAVQTDKYIATAPPVKGGRVRLIHYIKEQSIALEHHRYGSILEIPVCR